MRQSKRNGADQIMDVKNNARFEIALSIAVFASIAIMGLEDFRSA